MTTVTFIGILCVGFVNGYMLYYAIRHTSNFNIELLSSALGAIGGATVIGLFSGAPGWIGPYGIGVFAGFVAYFTITLALILNGKFQPVDQNKAMIIAQSLTGSPHQ